MKAFVDEARCQGHGRCYAIAPEVFGPKDDMGHSEVLCGEIAVEGAVLVAKVRRAVDACPERAISLEEAHDAEPRPA